MNRIPTKPALLCLTITALLGSQAAFAEFTANADVTSDYVFRGESLSADHMAVQGGVDYAHDSGFYAGAWLSNVDNREVSGTEYDVYGGITQDFGPVTVDLEYLTYNYTKKFLANGREIKMGLKYDWATLNYYVGDTGDHTDNTYGYIELGAKFQPVETVEIALHYGTLTGDYAKVVGADWNDKQIADYAATVSKELDGGFKLSATYAEREHSKPKPYVMLYKEFSL